MKRRARYVAMALAGIGTATHATACVCLSPSFDAGDPFADADLDANQDAPPFIPVDANEDAHFVFDADIRYPDANYDVALERDVGALSDTNDSDLDAD